MKPTGRFWFENDDRYPIFEGWVTREGSMPVLMNVVQKTSSVDTSVHYFVPDSMEGLGYVVKQGREVFDTQEEALDAALEVAQRELDHAIGLLKQWHDRVTELGELRSTFP